MCCSRQRDDLAKDEATSLIRASPFCIFLVDSYNPPPKNATVLLCNDLQFLLRNDLHFVSFPFVNDLHFMSKLLVECPKLSNNRLQKMRIFHLGHRMHATCVYRQCPLLVALPFSINDDDDDDKCNMCLSPMSIASRAPV